MEGVQALGRSSAMTLPSFGRLPGGTISTSPRSLVTNASVSAILARQIVWGLSDLAGERHGVRVLVSRDHKSEFEEFRVVLANAVDLFGAHEHAFDLRGLIGAAHPSLDPQIGASAHLPRDECRQVAERKPDQRIIRIERCHNDLADLAASTGSPVPGRTISTMRFSFTTMPSLVGVSYAMMPISAVA